MRNIRLAVVLLLTAAALSTTACTNPTGPTQSQDTSGSKI